MTLPTEQLPPSKRKYARLLQDPNVKRWHENVARGSPVTADVYLRRLGNYCEKTKTTPTALLSYSELDLYNLLLDLVSSMEQARREATLNLSLKPFVLGSLIMEKTFTEKSRSGAQKIPPH